MKSTSTARRVRSSSQSMSSPAKARLSRVAPELADPVRSLEVLEHESINSHEVLVAIRATAVSERSQVPD